MCQAHLIVYEILAQFHLLSEKILMDVNTELKLSN